MDIFSNLSGYQIVEKVYTGARTVVYRGIRDNNQQPVIIKLLRNQYPSFNDLIQFRNHYNIAKNLNSPLIIATYSLEPYQNSYALIMEDFGGISLQEWLVKAEKVILLREFLEIAIALCNILDLLYRERIIHKDIKPSNILINPQTKQVKLIDFSLASKLSSEAQEIPNVNSLEGTLAYLSPEQTGQMQRGIDYRSDFYSLGVTFYELFTGELPFQSNDPIELVHCHLTKTPISAHQINSNIPLALSEIIGKLMAKNADNRYQAALEIKHDLEICLDELQKAEDIASFKLEQQDTRDRWIVPEKLDGSENEFNSNALDFSSVIKLTQALSSAIELDELLKQLTQIILQNSGADKCILVLPQDEIWQVRAISTPESTELCSEPLDSHPNVPIQLIRYVQQTQAMVVINELQTDLPFIDDYLSQLQPKSLLCLPILSQGNSAGIFYLSNQSTYGAFTSDRLTVINFLCTQAAISLENAQLYAREQDKSRDLQVVLDQLQLSQLRFKNLFERSADAILILGNEGFIDCNQAAVELFGYTQKSQLSNIHPSLISPELQSDGQSSMEKANAMIAKALETGMHQFEWLHQRANNEVFWAEVLLCVVFYNGTQLLQSVVRDISDRKRTEAKLNQRSVELEETLKELQHTQIQMVQSEKMSALGQLVAGVAHEINNPVNFIYGNLVHANNYAKNLWELLELYQKHYPEPHAEIQEHAEAIDLNFLLEDMPNLITSMQVGAERIQKIVVSLRTFSRMDEADMKAVNIHEGIDSTLMILQHRLKTKSGIEIIKAYGELPLVECYAGQLNQVFMNLLSNAIDALEESYERGQITSPTITISSTFVNNVAVRIQISDNGIGIPAEIRNKLFDPFFTTKPVGKGTGMGLSISYQIVVNKHSGTLECISEPGQGSTFVITIPIQQH